MLRELFGCRCMSWLVCSLALAVGRLITCSEIVVIKCAQFWLRLESWRLRFVYIIVNSATFEISSRFVILDTIHAGHVHVLEFCDS